MSLRPRFSLLSLLLLTGLVGLSAAYWKLSQDHTAIEADRQRLRDELGYLVVHDPDLAYCRLVPTNVLYTWKYRIYLPDGHTWFVHAQHSDGSSKLRCPTGRFTLTISFNEIPGMDNWGVIVDTGRGSISGVLKAVSVDQIMKEGISFIAMSATRSRQQERAPDKPIKLLAIPSDISIHVDSKRLGAEDEAMRR